MTKHYEYKRFQRFDIEDLQDSLPVETADNFLVYRAIDLIDGISSLLTGDNALDIEDVFVRFDYTGNWPYINALTRIEVDEPVIVKVDPITAMSRVDLEKEYRELLYRIESLEK